MSESIALPSSWSDEWSGGGSDKASTWALSRPDTITLKHRTQGKGYRGVKRKVDDR